MIIHVAKKFTFQHNPRQTGSYFDEKEKKELPVFALEGDRQDFLPGIYDVPEYVANHWYVQAHLEGFVEPMPQRGQPDYAQRAAIAARAGRNTTSVEEAAPRPAPPPPGVQPAPRHYFAGQPIEDKERPEAPSWMSGR
jgi:hypothetical protein